MATTLESTTLRDIAMAVADELQLDDGELLSVSQVTVSVTYQVNRHENDSWLDRWYDEYVRAHEELPF